MSKPIAAYGESNLGIDPSKPGTHPNNRKVIFMFPDKEVHLYGGSVAWQNKNQYLVKFDSIARANGAIGQDDQGYAIFGNKADSRKAVEAQFKSSNLTLNQMIQKHVKGTVYEKGGTEPGQPVLPFAESLALNANLNVDTSKKKFKDLTPEQQKKFLDAFQELVPYDRGKMYRKNVKSHFVDNATDVLPGTGEKTKADTKKTPEDALANNYQQMGDEIAKRILVERNSQVDQGKA